MIKARHIAWVTLFFKIYITRKMKNNFHEIVVEGDMPKKNKSVLMIGNHVGWWDGFWVFYLCFKYIHKNFFFMMDEKELLKRKIFTKTGGFSIQKSSRSVIESLNYVSELLQKPQNLVLMFPQGKIFSMYSDKIHFEKGISRIQLNEHSSIFLMVQMIEYFEHPKPTSFLYLKEVETMDDIENQYNAFYSECFEKHRAMSI